MDGQQQVPNRQVVHRVTSARPPATVDVVEWWAQILAGILSQTAMALDGLRGRTTRQFAGSQDVLPAESRPVPVVVDAGLDAALRGVAVTVQATRTAARIARPVINVALRPPLVPTSWWPATALEAMAERGRRDRLLAEQQTNDVFGALVPAVLNAVLDRVDLTQLVRERVELDAIVEDVDIGRIIARLDFNEIVDLVPIDRIINRLDINAIVERVDVNAIVQRIDIDSIVARVDIQAILDRLDLAEIAQEVIEDVNLPEIIRESSGALASESVRGVRMGSITADERINQVVDRVLKRRNGRQTQSPVRSNDSSQ